MKRFLLLLLIAFNLFACIAHGQSLSVKDFLSVSSLSPKKFDNYISRKNFIAINRWFQNDTIINSYSLRGKRKDEDTQMVRRMIETYEKGKSFSFAFNTSSRDEYIEAKKELKESGFICRNEMDFAASLFQRKNISVHVNTIIKDSDTLYSFRFQEEDLPSLSSIRFAEDLLKFTSHEYLLAAFGEKNVRSDLYYFSASQINKCSILFPNTKRQAVFIWKDETNLCGLSSILIGGNMTTSSAINYNEVIAENAWRSREGLYSGMSLSTLARLNGGDFKFYGKKSEFPLMVVPDNTGNINFKKNLVVLGCLSPNGSQLLDNTIISTDKILEDNPGMYVFMLMLSPASIK